MEESKNNSGSSAVKFGLIGLGVGLVAGATAAILLAPKSGKETRELIVVKTGQAKDATIDKFKRADKSAKESDQEVNKKTTTKKK